MNGDSIAFVGDALRCAGFALAGVTVYEAAPGREADALDRARAAAQVVLVDARCAARIPPAILEAALAAIAPVTSIVTARGAALAIDPIRRARRLLGLDA